MHPAMLRPQIDLPLKPRRSDLNSSRRRSHVGSTVTLCTWRTNFDIVHCHSAVLAKNYLLLYLAGIIFYHEQDICGF